MVHAGVVRAEAQPAASVLGTDKFVIQRFGGVPNNYYTPFEATISEVNSYVQTNALAGSHVLAIGTVTLVAGTATVALASIAAGSKVFLCEANAAPNALGYVITAGVNFVIHSANGADTSVVSYIVFA